MNPRETLNQKFETIQINLENLELNVLQAIWNLENAVSASNKEHALLRTALESLILQLRDSKVPFKKSRQESPRILQEFESDRRPFDNKNNQLR